MSKHNGVSYVDELEVHLQERIIETATLAGWLVYHTHDSRRSEAGFPDLVMIRDGVLLAFELKRGEAEVRRMSKTPRGKLQRAWIAAFQQVNRVAAAVVSPADEGGVMRLLTEPRKRRKDRAPANMASVEASGAEPGSTAPPSGPTQRSMKLSAPCRVGPTAPAALPGVAPYHCPALQVLAPGAPRAHRSQDQPRAGERPPG